MLMTLFIAMFLKRPVSYGPLRHHWSYLNAIIKDRNMAATSLNRNRTAIKAASAAFDRASVSQLRLKP